MPQHLVASGGYRGVVVSGRCHSTWLRVVDPEGLLSVGDATAPGCEWWIQRGCCQWKMPQHLIASGGPEGLLSVGDATAPGCEWLRVRGCSK